MDSISSFNFDSAISAFKLVNTTQGRYLAIDSEEVYATFSSEVGSSLEEIDRFVKDQLLSATTVSESRCTLIKEVSHFYAKKIEDYKQLSDQYKNIFSTALAYFSSSHSTEAEEVNKIHSMLKNTFKDLDEKGSLISKALIEKPEKLQKAEMVKQHKKKHLRIRKKVIEFNLEVAKENLKRTEIFKTLVDSLPEEIFNLGLHDANKHEDLLRVNRSYGGMKRHSIGEKNTLFALRLLNQVIFNEGELNLYSEEDVKGLLRLCQNRLNMTHYSHLLTKASIQNNFSEVVKEVQESIDQLDDPKSNKILSLKPGVTSLVIPGGWAQHYVSYEFRKEGDSYYFIIHNRGDKSNDKRLHGSLSFEDPATGKTYGKKVIKIKTDKNALKDSAFIEKLLVEAGSFAGKADTVYNHIVEHFLT